jgi:hypothetical protein
MVPSVHSQLSQAVLDRSIAPDIIISGGTLGAGSVPGLLNGLTG